MPTLLIGFSEFVDKFKSDSFSIFTVTFVVYFTRPSQTATMEDRTFPTELLEAVTYGEIQSGADVNAADIRGYTPLIRAAAEYGHVNLVSILVSSGADVNITTIEDETALIIASRKGNDECVTLIGKAEANINHVSTNGVNAVSDASFFGHASCLTALINMGADVNLTNNQKSTPLMIK